MIGYTPSHLTENEVILEKLNQIIDYLTKNPSYQVYAYNGGFVEGTLTYEIANITDSRNINVADVVIFNNGYYGVISEITETEFTLASGISLIGPQGAKGDKGDKGDLGNGIYFYFKPIAEDTQTIDFDYLSLPKGRTLQSGDILFSIVDSTFGNIGWALQIEGTWRLAYAGALAGAQGQPGEPGRDGISTYFVDGHVDSETTDVLLADINLPTGRNLQVGDILISSYADTYGECAVVTTIQSTMALINYIGNLRGKQGVSVKSISIQEV